MNQISFNLVDYTFQRKIKPHQNLFLLIASILWLVILSLLFFQNEALARIAGYLMIVSVIPILFFVFLSILLLFNRKNIGVISLEHGQMRINENSYDVGQAEFVLNIDQQEWLDDSIKQEKKVKTLPIWGNYIVLNSGQKFEFKPNEKLMIILDDISVSGYKKRPALMVKTADLFDSLMSTMWAAS